MTQYNVEVPRIEDEIERAWWAWSDKESPELTTEECRATFEAGFRLARTVMVTGLTGAVT